MRQMFLKKQEEQSAHAQQEWNSFCVSLTDLFQQASELIRDIPYQPRKLSGVVPCVNLFSQKKVALSASTKEIDNDNTETIREQRLILEWCLLLSLCCLISLKQVDTVLHPSYSELESRAETASVDQFDLRALHPSILHFLRGNHGTHTQAFCENPRLVELRFMTNHPHRFLQLIDPEHHDQLLVTHHLAWLRNLSNPEYEFVSSLPDEEWDQLSRALDSPETWMLFARYHVFGLSGVSQLLDRKQGALSSNPFQHLTSMLRPFVPWSSLHRLQTLTPQILKMFPQEKCEQLVHYCSTFSKLTLLEEDQWYLPCVVRGLYSLSDVTHHLVKDDEEVTSTLLRDLWEHPSLAECWKKVRATMDVKQDIYISHPYYKALLVNQTRAMHEQAVGFVREAQKYQEGLAAKDYYPTYFNNYTYFVVAWVIALIIVMLFVVALIAYGSHRTQVIRAYQIQPASKNTTQNSGDLNSKRSTSVLIETF